VAYVKTLFVSELKQKNGWESIRVAETVAGFEVLELSWRKLGKKTGQDHIELDNLIVQTKYYNYMYVCMYVCMCVCVCVRVCVCVYIPI
jgi:hypothetical protein